MFPFDGTSPLPAPFLGASFKTEHRTMLTIVSQRLRRRCPKMTFPSLPFQGSITSRRRHPTTAHMIGQTQNHCSPPSCRDLCPADHRHYHPLGIEKRFHGLENFLSRRVDEKRNTKNILLEDTGEG